MRLQRPLPPSVPAEPLLDGFSTCVIAVHCTYQVQTIAKASKCHVDQVKGFAVFAYLPAGYAFNGCQKEAERDASNGLPA